MHMIRKTSHIQDNIAGQTWVTLEPQ